MSINIWLLHHFFPIFQSTVLHSNRLYDPDVLYRVLLYSYFCVRHRFSSNVLFSFPSAFVMWPEHIRLLTSLEDKVARQKNQKLFYCRKVQHYFPLYGSQSSKCVRPFQYFSMQSRITYSNGKINQLKITAAQLLLIFQFKVFWLK